MSRTGGPGGPHRGGRTKLLLGNGGGGRRVGWAGGSYRSPRDSVRSGEALRGGGVGKGGRSLYSQGLLWGVGGLGLSGPPSPRSPPRVPPPPPSLSLSPVVPKSKMAPKAGARPEPSQRAPQAHARKQKGWGAPVEERARAASEGGKKGGGGGKRHAPRKAHAPKGFSKRKRRGACAERSGAALLRMRAGGSRCEERAERRGRNRACAIHRVTGRTVPARRLGSVQRLADGAFILHSNGWGGRVKSNI